MSTSLPIDKIDGTSPPRFKWKQTVSTPVGRTVVEHSGMVHMTLEEALINLIILAKQQGKQIKELQQTINTFTTASAAKRAEKLEELEKAEKAEKAEKVEDQISNQVQPQTRPKKK